ncbi:efflux transporter, RND family, MFP subunit [Rhodovulum sp. P5]|uniref:efflux RND transporter periplasmic adaptor subunit n=1 Tax=Rhodovulum sp. P5 TaxID=1564506 RepID=UPI0009C39C65|nr:efflux RND transporter periplasmic adaptor subunit [Rhodovulum sp. P5]ARE40849.1 efflux transporter, RND family, MFP subunit [Rhodovulum sp. P5]
MSAISRIFALAVAALAGAGAVIVARPYLFPEEPSGARSAEGSAHSRPPVYGPAFAAASGRLVEVSEMSAAQRIRLGGTVEPDRTVRLSAEASGRVTFVAGEEGDRVAEGDIVVGLDTDAIDPQYRAAWADLSEQMAGLANARTQLVNDLYGPTTPPMGGTPQAAFDQAGVPLYNMFQSMMGGMPGTPYSGPMQTQSEAQRNFATASAARYDYERQLAALSAAQSRLDGLDAQLRDRRAIAPWNGVIMKRFVRVGDQVQPGQPVAEFADVDALVVRIDVPVAMVENLHLGERVPLSIAGNNIWAPVKQIYPAADPSAHTVPVKLALPYGAPAAPGMYAVAWIGQEKSGSPSALSAAIPASAVTYRGSLPLAFVAGRDGRVEMRVVRLGDRQGDRVAVLSGLKPGEMVVDTPAPDLKSGQWLAVTGG